MYINEYISYGNPQNALKHRYLNLEYNNDVARDKLLLFISTFNFNIEIFSTEIQKF